MKRDQVYYKGGKLYNDPVVNYRVKKQTEIIMKYVPIRSHRILDIGCYGGLLLQSLSHLGYINLYGSDIFDSHHTIKVPVTFSIEDITKKTSFKADTFELVIVSHVIEHLYDVKAALAEIRRITKKNGFILISIPLDINISARLKVLFFGRIGDPFTAGGHIKFYHPEDFEKMLHKHKLKISVKEYSGLGYGILDATVIGFISKYLAKKFPNLFAGEAHYLLENKNDTSYK